MLYLGQQANRQIAILGGKPLAMYQSYREGNGLPLPLKGTSKTFYERLTSYISFFDETWAARIQPIQKGKLQEFESHFALENYRVKLPDTYYCFLQTMGENDGGLITDTIEGYSEISLDVLMKVYDKSDAPYVPFIEVPISGFALFFNLNKNCEIVEIFRPGMIYAHSKETFEQLVFRCAFQKFFLQAGKGKIETLYPKMNYKTLQIKLKRSSEKSHFSINDYHSLVATMQRRFLITEEWFSNQDGLLTDCYVGTTSGKESIIIIENRQGNLHISISGYDVKLIDNLTNFFKEYSSF